MRQIGVVVNHGVGVNGVVSRCVNSISGNRHQRAKRNDASEGRRSMVADITVSFRLWRNRNYSHKVLGNLGGLGALAMSEM
ncbi:hypothetical protein HORIV_14010 [Vreelandella olivaria]|uniref:Uncharacterized protein n=1 Tax=Vreelandella olivaria TaxID=390919 RepID=A0ABN5WVF1_9GAMM|nr:hypothetical protein HORIV_14010 [Halomonas olivaria]